MQPHGGPGDGPRERERKREQRQQAQTQQAQTHRLLGAIAILVMALLVTLGNRLW
jgi:hypothetical protein